VERHILFVGLGESGVELSHVRKDIDLGCPLVEVPVSIVPTGKKHEKKICLQK
jgi:hypothetical protein